MGETINNQAKYFSQPTWMRKKNRLVEENNSLFAFSFRNISPLKIQEPVTAKKAY